MGFNPRPRAGGDIGFLRGRGGSRVSIHAPVRGATIGPHVHVAKKVVSIHAPVRGATLSCSSRTRSVSKFQSTPPCGGRLGPYRLHKAS
ncbi:MAG: hypothetical protein BIP78_0928 [Candidatus Bipolaricaulis sibiricus]|uniref:Uncharacterized protein n=1 Tax=Bipolaricaulis sibiricus TaxID=2501609 RepID=A0A410FUM2_BIPS1|nr:MAG: hypothetical protein BIP78_0928 [Candidatus Bipolaricaulis sibiricus]